MKSILMKKQQFQNHIKRINRLSTLSSLVILVAAMLFYVLSNPKFLEVHIFEIGFIVMFVLILIHLKANNLKQKAIIRYMTDSISDNEL